MRWAAIMAAVLVLGLAACGSKDKKEGASGAGAGKSDVVTAQIVRPRVNGAPPAADQPCGPGEGQTIAAVEIPARHIPEQRVAPATVDGKTGPEQVIPAYDIPAQRVPAQCAKIAKAPAGCLGDVDIPAVTIPAAVIPGIRMPGFKVGSVTVPPLTAEPEVVQQTTVAAEHVAGDCAQKVKPGEYRPVVYRGTAYRGTAYRGTAYRGSAYRGSECSSKSGGGCVDGLSVDGQTIPGVTVGGVTVDSATIRGVTLPEVRSKCVKVARGDGETDYAVCTDVLFAFNKATVRPKARSVLRQVARSLRKRFAGQPVVVDGHTDAKGDPAYNQTLSERRAEAVGRELKQLGIGSGRISTQGFGETRPIAKNTKPDGSDDPSGRRRNRRVVVGVRRD